MCYTGGPYCYKDRVVVAQNAQKRMAKNPTENNKKKLKDAVLKLDSTVKGQEQLSEKIKEETDPLVKDHLEKRLHVAKSSRDKQVARRKARQSQAREKQLAGKKAGKERAKKAEEAEENNRFPEGFSKEAHEAFRKMDRNVPEKSYELSARQAHAVSAWAENHDKDGKYIYKDKEHVADVVSHDGTVYHRIGSETGDGREYDVDTPYSFRIQVNEELDQESADRLSNITKYAYATTGGEKSMYEDTIQDSPNSIVVHLDTTKNRAYRRMDRFMDNLQSFYNEGTPVRKKTGDRALEGVKASKIEVYADNVY